MALFISEPGQWEEKGACPSLVNKDKLGQNSIKKNVSLTFLVDDANSAWAQGHSPADHADTVSLDGPTVRVSPLVFEQEVEYCLPDKRKNSE